MKFGFGKKALAAGVLLGLLALGGCGNISKNIAKDGTGAGELVWPAATDTTPIHKGGTTPTLDSVRAIHAGMAKNQIAALVGYPHFAEGVFGVREWNYLFNFYPPGSSTPTVCQYKVLFDEHMLARSFYWHPAACADLLKPPAAAPALRNYTLSADALFEFDKSALRDIKPGGRDELDKLAAQLAADDGDIEHVSVVGYTDRLGSDAYNDRLSKARADTVMDYLVSKGVPGNKASAAGRGKSNPVTDGCHQDDRHRKALIECLAPDRRVVVGVAGKRAEKAQPAD